jgi:benzylsuccinate CoA-transferase BbsE subunit
MLGYPVSTVADMAIDPQLEERAFFQTIAGVDGKPETHCGAFAVVDGERAALRYPPGTPFVEEAPARKRAGARP